MLWGVVILLILNILVFCFLLFLKSDDVEVGSLKVVY